MLENWGSGYKILAKTPKNMLQIAVFVRKVLF